MDRRVEQVQEMVEDRTDLSTFEKVRIVDFAEALVDHCFGEDDFEANMDYFVRDEYGINLNFGMDL